MIEKFIKLLKMGSFTIPKELLYNYKKLGIDADELIVLIFLLNQPEKILYNPKVISNVLNMETKFVLEIINNLVAKNCLNLEVEKNKAGLSEEYLDLGPFYQKLSILLIDDSDPKEKHNVFDIFEQEFGRTLSPMEYQIINAWFENNYSEELVVAALKEAIYNGVSSLRYIDKILYEWQKKGIKTPDDIRLNNVKHKNKKEDVKEVFDYDWLSGEE